MTKRFLLILALILSAYTPCLAEQSQEIEIVGRDASGHGILCKMQGKTILMVDGTPQQMGTAHGNLLKKPIGRMFERVLYMFGGTTSIHYGKWFFDVMEEIESRTRKHTPKRFLIECDALSKAAGISKKHGRYGNLFPERFHCSGVAACGKATVGGAMVHARVLDYMCYLNLQANAVVILFMPEGRNAWISHSYAGLIGTVTAMNEKGLAVGEMGGRGEGDWDGVPMSYLLRDIMERASTVEEGLKILHNSPRTCEYYYVLSDKNRSMIAVRCVPNEVLELKPGQQHELLPHVPEDTVIISGGQSAKMLSKRLQENYGKIDAKKMIEIIKHPVASKSNLHNAVFTPESLDMWVADAKKWTRAYSQPYVRCNIAELIKFYKKAKDEIRPRMEHGLNTD